MAMELTREERDAVRSEILTVLSEVGDFTGYVDRGKVTKGTEVG
ncbi:MAG: hypothetical protein Q8O56_03970 [Solirubrobacteraceae bacterium]|nr:hypothetical protein [Solirubrobacteraceae bacterium]